MTEPQFTPLPDIVRTLIFRAPIQKVWDAVATSEGLAAWFMPNDMQPAEGHEFHLQAGPFGQSPCKVTIVHPPHELAFRWGKDWTLSFRLQEVEEGTEFTLVHSGWSAEQVTEFGQPHGTVREMMSGGWEKMVLSLKSRMEG
ncbi:SRPBCC domain-containing protein [Paenibacillus sp. JX-17]|uniref:SRPBCC domain-containing protein n=1 Tax=Paenibacillus lacisoli TaxID=3064525 RepID=A0ABT9CAP9_9BACL|nr:SRPBCC domain-containing protein [Paenibacillus sp. JX-17]MDO7906333.1 SRPBCC domain-containing protein [Paenibacillus sp. JX-17]